MQSNHIPEIQNDPTVQALISHFDAVIQSSQNATHFSVVCGMSVQIGEAEFMPLPHTYLAAPVSKAELVSEVRRHYLRVNCCRCRKKNARPWAAWLANMNQSNLWHRYEKHIKKGVKHEHSTFPHNRIAANSNQKNKQRIKPCQKPNETCF